MTTRIRTRPLDRKNCRRPASALPGKLFVSLLALAFAAAGCDRPMSLAEVRKLQEEERYAETLDSLRKHLEEKPDDAEAQLLYGTALSRTGASRVAVWSLRKAAESPDFKLQATLELSGAQARSGNWDEAIAAANTALELDPDNLSGHVLRGEAILNDGKHPERALEDFDFVLDQDPTSMAALTSRASALLMLGQVDEAAEAIDQLESLAEKNPMDGGSQSQLCAAQAVLRQERAEKDEAEKRFEECLERFPGQAVVVDSAISFFDASDKRDRSDAILAKALEVVPQSISYRRTLALRIAASGDDARALAVLKAGLETDDRELRTAIWTDITNFHLERDELPEAVAAFEQALAGVEKPQQLAILTHADLLARAGRHAEAMKVAKDLENESYRALIESRIALNEGHPKRALALLDKVFPVWPDNAGARYYAARAAEQMGDFARAIEEYRQAIRSAPEETEAGLRLSKLYLAAGAFEDAWSNAGQYVNVHRDDPEGVRVMVAAAARDEKANLQGLFNQLRGSMLLPVAMAARARQVAEHKDAAAGLAWIETVAKPVPDWTHPGNAELLRTKVLLLQEAKRTKDAEKAIADALAVHPDSTIFLEIRAALLEAEGGDPAAVRAAFEKAVEKDGKNWRAVEGIARAYARAGDDARAIEYFDRSTKLHPESPEAAREAAMLLAKQAGKGPEVEKRWIELLKEHPWDAKAAQALAELRSARGDHGEGTLDLAERAVMFGGGEPAQALLVGVHEARGEKERAQQVSQAFKDGKPIPPRNPPPTSTPTASGPAAAPAKDS